MSVSRIYADGEFYTIKNQGQEQLPEKFHSLVEFGILASQKEPFDPMEKALRKIGDCCLKNTEHLHDDWSIVREYPLSQELLSLSLVWRSRIRGPRAGSRWGCAPKLLGGGHVPPGTGESDHAFGPAGREVVAGIAGRPSGSWETPSASAAERSPRAAWLVQVERHLGHGHLHVYVQVYVVSAGCAREIRMLDVPADPRATRGRAEAHPMG